MLVQWQTISEGLLHGPQPSPTHYTASERDIFPPWTVVAASACPQFKEGESVAEVHGRDSSGTSSLVLGFLGLSAIWVPAMTSFPPTPPARSHAANQVTREDEVIYMHTHKRTHRWWSTQQRVWKIKWDATCPAHISITLQQKAGTGVRCCRVWALL